MEAIILLIGIIINSNLFNCQRMFNKSFLFVKNSSIRADMKTTYIVAIIYIMYMVTILTTPWRPSLYNVLVDTIEFTVTELVVVILYNYHDSIENSKKTILNFQMQVVLISYGGIYFTNLIKFLPFNLFPIASVELLQSYSSVMCLILEGEWISWLFLINLVILIVLHSIFITFPSYFLELSENILKKIMFSLNIVCLISLVNDFLLVDGESLTICSKFYIFQLRNKLNLVINDQVPIHKGKETTSLCLCLFAGLSVTIMKLIRLYRVRKMTKQYLLNKFDIIVKRPKAIRNLKLFRPNVVIPTNIIPISPQNYTTENTSSAQVCNLKLLSKIVKEEFSLIMIIFRIRISLQKLDLAMLHIKMTMVMNKL